ncbi:hypothetical protein GCM10029964_025220 [Kibdelosporangium lantanae]
MPTCAQGHDSTDDEYCDVCGLAFDSSPTPAASTNGTAAPDAAGPRECPACGAPLDDRFCEDCGADSLAAPPPRVASPAPDPSPGASPAAEPVVATSEPVSAPVAKSRTWSVVVSADRKYYESVKADGGPDADSIQFPPYCPDRHFPCTASRSASAGAASPAASSRTSTSRARPRTPGSPGCTPCSCPTRTAAGRWWT